jgi:hypothetical protein
MKWVWENRWWAESASAVSSRLACGGDGAEGSQRRGEDHECVKLDGSDGARYILRYGRSQDEWEIQMMELPPPMTGR